MPLTRVSLRKGKSASFKRALLDEIYQAMRETFDVPHGDRFMTITEHDDEDFSCDANYLDIARTDDLILIQLTISNTRTVEKKKALYQRIALRLAKNPGVRPEDVFINLVEVVPENWSFGHGIAQYAKNVV